MFLSDKAGTYHHGLISYDMTEKYNVLRKMPPKFEDDPELYWEWCDHAKRILRKLAIYYKIPGNARPGVTVAVSGLFRKTCLNDTYFINNKFFFTETRLHTRGKRNSRWVGRLGLDSACTLQEEENECGLYARVACP